MTFGKILSDGWGALKNAQSDRAQTEMFRTPAFSFGGEQPDSRAIEHVAGRIAQNQESPFLTAIQDINPKINSVDNIEVTLNNLPSSPQTMTKSDYDKAYLRELFRRAGHTDVTDGELAAFQTAVTKYTGAPFALNADLATLRKIHGETGKITTTTSEWRQAVVDAGMREIYSQRQQWSATVDAAQSKAQRYGEDALKGWAALHVNAPVNLINGITEPLRGLAVLGGAYIPAVPRWEATDRSEYWQTGGKGQVAEIAGTLTVGVLAAPSAAGILATTPAKIITTADATYNIGAAAAGVDPTQRDAQGNYRPMSTLERTLRITGGVATAVGVSQTLGGATNAGTSMTATKTEAVTAEGIHVKVPVTDRAPVSTTAEMRGVEQGRRNVQMHEKSASEINLGHTIEKHVGKSEAWLRNRLETDPNLRNTDFVSTFFNEETANRAQGRFVKQHREQIDRWLKSGEHRLEAEVTMEQPVGIVVERGKGGSVETARVRLTLVRDDSAQGWHFKTSFPIKSTDRFKW